MPPELLEQQLRQWRRRVPRLVLAAVVLLVNLPLVVAETFLDDEPCTVAVPCRYPIGSTIYHLSAPAEFLAVAAVVMAFVLPRAAPWVALVGAALLAGPAAVDSSFPRVWQVVAAGYLVLVVLDLAGRARQGAESRAWPAPVVPYPGAPDGRSSGGHLPRDEDTRAAAAVVLALGCIAAAALGAWHVAGTRSTQQFEAHALRVTGTVTRVDDADGTVVVAAAGRTAELSPLGDYDAGQTVPVLVDAADPRHLVLAAEPEDPSWRAGLAAVVLAVALGLSGRLWTRGTGRARLVHGGPAVRLRVGRSPTGVLITAVDDVRFERPLALTKELLPSAVLLARDGWLDPDDADVDGPDDDRDRDGDLELPDLADLDDAALAAWADRTVAEDEEWDDEEDGYPRADLRSAVDGGEVATVVGLRQDGAPVAVLTDDGATYVSSGAVRDPWSVRRLLDGRPRAVGATLGRVVADRYRPPVRDHAGAGGLSDGAGIPGRPERLVGAVLRLVTPVAEPLALLLALAVYPVTTWLLDGESNLGDLRLGVASLVLAGWLRSLASLRMAPLRPHPRGLLHCGWWSDELLPVHRVTAVVAGEQSVVLRLAHPEDALALPAGAVVPYVEGIRNPVTPTAAAAVIDAWLAQCVPDHRPGWRRPARTLLPAVVAVTCFVVAWVLPRLA